MVFIQRKICRIFSLILRPYLFLFLPLKKKFEDNNEAISKAAEQKYTAIEGCGSPTLLMVAFQLDINSYVLNAERCKDSN